jgi:hypothetical protein
LDASPLLSCPPFFSHLSPPVKWVATRKVESLFAKPLKAVRGQLSMFPWFFDFAMGSGPYELARMSLISALLCERSWHGKLFYTQFSLTPTRALPHCPPPLHSL